MPTPNGCARASRCIPQRGQYAAIKARDGLELMEPPQKALLMDGKVKLSFKLPVHGISLLILSPSA